MSRKLTFIVMALLAAAIGGTAALAGPAVGTVGKLFARGTLTSPVQADADGIVLRTDSTTDHAVQEITFPPGSSSGWHQHPGLVLVTIKTGTLAHYELGDSFVRRGPPRPSCERETINAGQTFWESGPEATLVRNETAETVIVYVTYILPTGAPLRVDTPDPVGCPVN
jgi:hypothetical protein